MSECEQYMINQIGIENRAMMGRIDVLEQAANGVASSVEELQAKSERDRAALEREIKGVITARKRIEDDLLAINKELMDDKQLLINNIKKRKSSGNIHTHTHTHTYKFCIHSIVILAVCLPSRIAVLHIYLYYYYYL